MPTASRFTMPRLIREPHAVYHGRSAELMTSHQLHDFDFCPQYYRRKRAGLIAAVDSDELLIGAATHALVLEGSESFERDYLVDDGPINPKTDKPYGAGTKHLTEWRQSQTKAVLSSLQYALVCQLVDSVRSHVEAQQLFANGEGEGTLRETYCGVACQIRPDWLSPDEGLVDLKTCRDLDEFVADCHSFGYVNQMAFYRAILKIVTGETLPVYLVAVEKREPYRCGVFFLAPEKLAAAQAANELALASYWYSRRADFWPTGYEKIRTIA